MDIKTIDLATIGTLPAAMQYEIVDEALTQEHLRHAERVKELDVLLRTLKPEMNLPIDLHPSTRATIRTRIVELEEIPQREEEGGNAHTASRK
jgi:hypothetical protein